MVRREDIADLIQKSLPHDSLDEVRHELKKIPKQKNSYELLITIHPTLTVRDILVGNNFPFLNKEITRLLPMQTGSLFDKNQLPACEKAVVSFLEKYGYYAPRVRVTAREHRRYAFVDLHVDLRKGPTGRIRNITFTGVESVNVEKLKNMISRTSHFKPVALKNALRKMRELYRKMGFVRSRINIQKITFDTEKKRVDLEFTVREAKRLKEKFPGKLPFKKTTLKQVTHFADQRSYDRYAIELAQKRLEVYFKRKGYPDVLIETLTQKDDKTITVTFLIKPGQRIDLKQIRLVGNRKIGSKKLKKNLESQTSTFFKRAPFRADLLIKDVQKIQKTYVEEGFLDANIKNPRVFKNKFGDQRIVVIPIREGRRYRLSSLRFQTDAILPLRTLRRKSGLRRGKPFTTERLEAAKVNLYEELFNYGYAYAEVKLAGDIHPDDKSVDITVQITRGPKAHVGKILVQGNTLTRESIIRSTLKINEGELFIYQKVLDAQLSLRQLGIFSTVKIETIGVAEKKEIVNLVVTVQETKTNILNLQGGFDNRSLGRAEFSYTNRNLFGFAKQLKIRGIAGALFNRAEVTFFAPRIFGASWNVANQYFAQYENTNNFNASSYGTFVNTLKNFGPLWSFGLKEDVTRTEVDEANSNVAVLGNSLFDNTFNTLTAFAIFDNRDNFSDPRKGLSILMKNEINTDLSDLSNTFNTVGFNINHFLGMGERFTLSSTLRYGQHLRIATKPRIPVNKLFFMGGSDTIRGFIEDQLNPSGGTFSLIVNEELHFKIIDTLKLAGFFDVGALSNNINTLGINDFRRSTGVGIRYFTPIGPLKFDWGFILDRQTGEPKSRLHFSFGYYF